MPKLRVDDGTQLYYEIDDFTDPWKEVDTVLLHHAAAGSVRRWYAWIPILARRFRVVRYDMRGHGESDIPPEPYRPSIDRLARDLAEVIDRLNIPKAHIVGASAGGIIAQQFAATYPERARSLSLIATVPGMSHTSTDYSAWVRVAGERGVKALFAEQARERFPADADPRLIDWFAEEAARTRLHVLGAFVPYMASLDLMPILPKITAPTFILAPGDDPLGPPETQQMLVKAIPNARLQVLEDYPHNISSSAPELCAQLVLDFILSLPDTRAS